MIATYEKPHHTNPDATLRDLIDEFGALRVFAVAAGALVLPNPRRPAPSTDTLDNHLRKDIGLPPRDGPMMLRGPFF